MTGKRTGSNKAIKFSNFSDEELRKFVENLDAVMFDCDGVIWLENQPMLNASALIKKLKSLGKKVFFITNNSTRTREEFLVKFNALGFEVEVDEIIGPSYLTALYLKEKNFQKKVYVVGNKGITQELAKVGIESLPVGPDTSSPSADVGNISEFQEIRLDPDVGAVVVGYDLHLSYKKLVKASSYIANQKCLFIATDTDGKIPTRYMTFPGTGPFVNAVQTASGCKPIVMGKPEPLAFEYISKRHQLDPDRVLMIGDSCKSDVLFGRRCGVWTFLVMSGCTKEEELHRWEESADAEENLYVPDYYLEDVNELYTRISTNM